MQYMFPNVQDASMMYLVPMCNISDMIMGLKDSKMTVTTCKMAVHVRILTAQACQNGSDSKQDSSLSKQNEE